MVKLVRQALRGTPLDTDPASPAPHRPATPAVRTRPARTLVEHKETEQAHVLLGCPGIGRLDERRFALGVLNNVLGGGMSSRLFQEIREQRGLAYSVYSYASQYADSGLFAVYAGCAPGKVDEVLDLTRAELARVAARRDHRGRAGPGQGDEQGLVRARPGGHRLADEPAGQGRAALRRPDAGGRAAGPGRRGHRRRTSTRSPRELLSRPMSLAVVGPFGASDFAAAG